MTIPWKRTPPPTASTKMINNILEGIEIRLNKDYLEHKAEWDELVDRVVYTGAIDAYFDYKLGTLEYRSVRFENELLEQSNFQGNAAVNYTDRETPWTRIIEHPARTRRSAAISSPTRRTTRTTRTPPTRARRSTVRKQLRACVATACGT